MKRFKRQGPWDRGRRIVAVTQGITRIRGPAARSAARALAWLSRGSKNLTGVRACPREVAYGCGASIFRARLITTACVE